MSKNNRGIENDEKHESMPESNQPIWPVKIGSGIICPPKRIHHPGQRECVVHVQPRPRIHAGHRCRRFGGMLQRRLMTPMMVKLKRANHMYQVGGASETPQREFPASSL